LGTTESLAAKLGVLKHKSVVSLQESYIMIDNVTNGALHSAFELSISDRQAIVGAHKDGRAKEDSGTVRRSGDWPSIYK